MNLSWYDWLACIAFVVLMLHGLCLFLWGVGFLRMFPTRPGTKACAAAQEQKLPHAVVLLAVRGADPSLADCLHGLLRQDYPSYEVCVILDSREDPAWELVLNHEATCCGKVRIHVLSEPRPTCSLKLSALLEAIGELEDSDEIVALIDSDVIPHASWLRDLALPLLEEGVGAATGIRWYSPHKAGWGTLVRYLWNAAASLHMYALEIPWGGSLAIRLDVLRRSDLLDKWSRSLFEDVGCRDSLHKLGLKVRWVPRATMVNRETIDMKGCVQFICRQLLDVRFYHSRWGTVLSLGCASALATVVGTLLAAAYLSQGNGWLAGGLAAYFVGMFLLAFWLEGRIDLASDRRNPKSAWFWLRTLLAAPLAQVVYLVCLVRTCLLRQVVWRGIPYHFDGPFSVRLIEYQPYTSAHNAEKDASVT